MYKRSLYVLPLALTVAAGTGPALAGNLDPAPASPPVVVAQPAPTYVGNDWTGFYGGGQLGYGDVGTSGAATVDGDGGFVGLHGGYMWDFGNAVIGAEIDYDSSEIELDAGAGSIDDIARLKLRAGWDAGNILYYGTVGTAAASANIGGVDYDDTGWLAGAGLSYDLGNNWVVGGEVLYHEFEDFDATGIDVDVTTVSARVSYRF
ncbi:porin family protein [Rhodophyticola sp. CCM32]|uniref:outer membrane protein n=1 Tax=Rhodophyticola sp. CCM32 TaxID=2916397 RepID=UPI00107F7E7A|nr:outer membrane beta-barrel protein [Rhodophyticola sp. CCM32]QBY00637.1 porin family protein [Rhodophyticola sp. CCM32]